MKLKKLTDDDISQIAKDYDSNSKEYQNFEKLVD